MCCYLVFKDRFKEKPRSLNLQCLWCKHSAALQKNCAEELRRRDATSLKTSGKLLDSLLAVNEKMQDFYELASLQGR
jgi:hypothetical protein